MKEITREWIAKAEQDYLIAIHEIEQDAPAIDPIYFHAQQCIEKYMKALLQENDVEFNKTHDLSLLLEDCLTRFPPLAEFEESIVELSSYAVDTRYPGLDASEDEALEAVEIMKRIRNRIRDYFKL